MITMRESLCAYASVAWDANLLAIGSGSGNAVAQHHGKESAKVRHL